MSQFLSIAILPGGDDAADEVYVIVRRYIDGSWRNYIERFTDRQFDVDTLYDAWFVDCAGWGGGTLDVVQEETTTTTNFRGTAYFTGDEDNIYYFDPDWNLESSITIPDAGKDAVCNASTSTGLETVVGYTKSVGGTTAIAKFDTDLNYNENWYVPDAGWGAGETVEGLAYDQNDEFLYVTGTGGFYKFEVATGDEVWHKGAIASNVSGECEIQADGSYIYTNDRISGGHSVKQWQPDGTQTGLGGPVPAHYDIKYDNDNDIIVTAGDSTSTVAATLNPSDMSVLNSYSDTGSASGVFIYGGYYYFCGQFNTGGYRVIKTDTSLNLVAGNSDAGTGFTSGGIILDWDGHIVVSTIGVLDSKIYIYDTDLNLLDTLSWGPAYPYGKPELGRIKYQNTETTYIDTSEATSGTPGVGCQLEGETVNILADGVKYPQQTVENCGIDTSVFTNPDTEEVIWGLPVRCYVKPMSIGLTSLSFIPHRNITHCLLNLFQSLDWEYGRETGDYDVIPYEYDAYDAGPLLFTGVKRLPFQGAYTQSGDVELFTDGNLPFTIRALAVYYGMEDMGERLLSTV